MLLNKDKRLLEEIKDTVRLIEENFDNENLLKYFIGNLKILTEKIIKSYIEN